jgi:hypothetical protein
MFILHNRSKSVGVGRVGVAKRLLSYLSNTTPTPTLVIPMKNFNNNKKVD